MHPSNSMERVINGRRYSVATANLLASNEYWDGSNWERWGRNEFLYRTPNGAYFMVSLSQWEGERDRIIPLSRDEAMALWDELPEHFESYETAFDVVP